MVKCRIVRRKDVDKHHPVYELYYDEGPKKFMLAGQKRKLTSNLLQYLITTKRDESIDKRSEHIKVKLKKNFLGTHFTICQTVEGPDPHGPSVKELEEKRRSEGSINSGSSKFEIGAVIYVRSPSYASHSRPCGRKPTFWASRVRER